MSYDMYQVSTLQALAKGYFYGVSTIEELLAHGDTGLGTFEGLDGEMIVLGGHCYRADDQGAVNEVSKESKTPFAALGFLKRDREFSLAHVSMAEVLARLNEEVAEAGRNQIFLARIDGDFEEVYARSEIGVKPPYDTLANVLKTNQKEFHFSHVKGSLVCLYFPNYMDRLNLADWHIHFISEDKKWGGHVFAFTMKEGKVTFGACDGFKLTIPQDPKFQELDLKDISKKEIESVEKAGE